MQAQEFWRAHLSAIDVEGISTADYARREGLVAQRLYAWRNRLKHGDIPAQPTPSDRVALRSRFVALEIDTYRATDIACTLKLAAGMELHLSGLPDVQWLASLVNASTRER